MKFKHAVKLFILCITIVVTILWFRNIYEYGVDYEVQNDKVLPGFYLSLYIFFSFPVVIFFEFSIMRWRNKLVKSNDKFEKCIRVCEVILGTVFLSVSLICSCIQMYFPDWYEFSENILFGDVGCTGIPYNMGVFFFILVIGIDVLLFSSNQTDITDTNRK